MRKKHFPCAEQVADDGHSVHERSFDDVERARVKILVDARLLRVFHHELIDALDQSVTQTLCKGIIGVTRLLDRMSFNLCLSIC